MTQSWLPFHPRPTSPSHQPCAIIQQNQFQQFLHLSLAPNTRKGYKRVWDLLERFTTEHNIPTLPLNENYTALIVSFFWQLGLNASTIRSYMSAVSYFHKINSLPDYTNSFVIRKVLLGASRLSTSPQLRKPISLPMLWALIDCIPNLKSNAYQIFLFQAMFALAFYALCRISELIFDPDAPHCLQLSDLEHLTTTPPASHPVLRINFRTFKHSYAPQSVSIFPQRPQRYCPVTIINRYLNSRNKKPGPLFIWLSGQPVSRSEFNKVLHSALAILHVPSSQYKSHSFRIGGATHAAQMGLSCSLIRSLGRWHSDAFMKYIRT